MANDALSKATPKQMAAAISQAEAEVAKEQIDAVDILADEANYHSFSMARRLAVSKVSSDIEDISNEEMIMCVALVITLESGKLWKLARTPKKLLAAAIKYADTCDEAEYEKLMDVALRKIQHLEAAEEMGGGGDEGESLGNVSA
jgi:hypothetical protein